PPPALTPFPTRRSSDLPAGRLAGLFTDSDLARLFEARSDAAFDLPIERVMTKTPVTIAPTTRLTEAVELLRSRKISELPVVDARSEEHTSELQSPYDLV